jgi:hypothetical protein
LIRIGPSLGKNLVKTQLSFGKNRREFPTFVRSIALTQLFSTNLKPIKSLRIQTQKVVPDRSHLRENLAALWISILLMPIRIHLYAVPEQDSSPTTSFTHVGKTEVCLTFFHSNDSLHCFILLPSS